MTKSPTRRSKSTQGISKDIEIAPLTNRRELRVFIDLPWRIYANDPAWVPPLRLERRIHLSGSNPFFQHGAWQAWLAYRNGSPVGRISAQIDELHRQHYGRNSGHFGLLEAEEDPQVFTALTHTAEQWLAAHNTTYITGPFNLSINQECGLLVQGFETAPVIMMPHGRAWYGRFLEEQGYATVKDLLAYWVKVDFEAPRVMRSLLGRYSNQVRLRTLRRKRLAEELKILRDIFNDAWSGNWGFVPMTEAEFAELGTSLRLLIPDDYVQIAEIDGEPVAFIVALPNLNEIFASMNGRLLPFAWAKLIWRLKRQQVRTGRVPLMGVRKRFQNTPLGMALAFLVIEAIRHALFSRGIYEVEMSWILEDNSGMRNILDSIGSIAYKRYRIYGKRLNPDDWL
ncbi:MAG: N-acetyltransferase [Gammaproteobacteria bacterium]